MELLDGPTGVFDRSNNVQSFFGQRPKGDVGGVAFTNLGTRSLRSPDDRVVNAIEDHPHRGLSSDLCLECHDGLQSHQLTIDQNTDPVGQSDRGVNAVRGKDDRATALLETGQRPVKTVDSLRVEIEGRLIQHQEWDLLEEGRGKPETLQHAAGVLSNQPISVVRKSEQIQDLIHPISRYLSQTGEEIEHLASSKNIGHVDPLRNVGKPLSYSVGLLGNV